MAESIIVNLDSAVYSKEAIVKCLYWYSNDFNVEINLTENQYVISLTPLVDYTEVQTDSLRKKLNREFLDYNLRDIVKKETNTIRELIIAKAFSHGEFDEEPKGDLMDPLGIKFL